MKWDSQTKVSTWVHGLPHFGQQRPPLSPDVVLPPVPPDDEGPLPSVVLLLLQKGKQETSKLIKISNYNQMSWFVYHNNKESFLPFINPSEDTFYLLLVDYLIDFLIKISSFITETFFYILTINTIHDSQAENGIKYFFLFCCMKWSLDKNVK